MLVLGYVAQAVDFRAPGRVCAFYLVDSEDSVLGVVGVEVLV